MLAQGNMLSRTALRWRPASMFFHTKYALSTQSGKIQAPPMVYISGEEMTAYTMKLILDKWIHPHCDISNWEFYDLSCKARDETEDQVLRDAVAAGKRICAIFKEPTITPTAIQKEALGLKKTWGSPNGLMRRGWNGITISRDTIHIPGLELGYKKPVFFERHAVGGEYSAGWAKMGKGRLVTTFLPDNQDLKAEIVDSRTLTDDHNVAVVYHNPLDNVEDLAHHFFSRCLAANIVPYVVTKKTVFKWQEGFWSIMKTVFDKHYKKDFLEAGILDKCGNDLQHLISDAATMQIIRWTHGGFGMAAHNYDGDMLTDEVSQVHRSPGFITSNLIGKREDGVMIKEFEASHGTVADMWYDHLAGKETSLNPLGMATALVGAMEHSATLVPNPEIQALAKHITKAMHNTFLYEGGTQDMAGPSGHTTEQFVDRVAWRIEEYLAGRSVDESNSPHQNALKRKKDLFSEHYDLDAVAQMFRKYDTDGNGSISEDEFLNLAIDLNFAPKVVAAGNKAHDS